MDAHSSSSWFPFQTSELLSATYSVTTIEIVTSFLIIRSWEMQNCMTSWRSCPSLATWLTCYASMRTPIWMGDCPLPNSFLHLVSAWFHSRICTVRIKRDLVETSQRYSSLDNEEWQSEGTVFKYSWKICVIKELMWHHRLLADNFRLFSAPSDLSDFWSSASSVPRSWHASVDCPRAVTCRGSLMPRQGQPLFHTFFSHLPKHFCGNFTYPAENSDDIFSFFSHLHLNLYLPNWIIGWPFLAGCPGLLHPRHPGCPLYAYCHSPKALPMLDPLAGIICLKSCLCLSIR